VQGIRCVFFDVGYTLVDEDFVWQQRCREQAETEEAKRLGLTPGRIYAAIEEAARAYQPQYRSVVARYGLTRVAPYRHAYEKLYPDAKPVLQALASRFVLGIIANQADGLRGRLQSWGIEHLFTHIMSSWEVRLMKPDPRLFHLSLNRAGCPADEALMVGDRLDNDIAPAKAVGMQTVWIRQGFGGLQVPRSDAYRPDQTIQSLRDLLPVLGVNPDSELS